MISSSRPRQAPTLPMPASRFIPYSTVAFVFLILYGSLYPFSDWRYPSVPLYTFLVTRPTLERTDLIQNVLVYAPLGLLLVLQLNKRRNFWPAVVLSSLLGLTLSFFVESVQQFLPARVASLSDLAMNLLGTFAGGLFAGFFSENTLTGKIVLDFRQNLLRPGVGANAGLAVLGIWVLSQTSPLVPSLDIAHLRHGLALIRQTYEHPELFDPAKMAVYTCYVFGLGMLALAIMRREMARLTLYLCLVGLVLFCKILIVSRQLSLEALLGAGAAAVLLIPAHRCRDSILHFLGIIAIFSGFTLFELSPTNGPLLAPFNWIPFSAQMSSLGGLESILEIIWPFMAIATLLRLARPYFHHSAAAVFAGMLVFGVVFLEEWLQQFIPGRYGDITQVLLAFSGWMIPWHFPDVAGATDGTNQKRVR